MKMKKKYILEEQTRYIYKRNIYGKEIQNQYKKDVHINRSYT